MPSTPVTDARAAIILNIDQDDTPQYKKGRPRGRHDFITQRNAKIIAALQSGASAAQVAADFGLSLVGVYAALRRKGYSTLDFRGSEYEQRKGLNERNETIIEKYKSGLSAEAIGQEYGITRERVCQIIRPLLLPQLKVERTRLAREALAAEEAGAKAEMRAERETRIAQAVAMVREGASRMEAIRQTGLSSYIVCKACLDAGLPHRYGRWLREPELEQRAADIRRQRAEGKTWAEIGPSNYSWATRNLPDLVRQQGPRSERKPKPARQTKPTPPITPDPWTQEKVEMLCRMYFDGCSAQQIADVLGDGITRSAVIGKSNRLRAQKLLLPPANKG